MTPEELAKKIEDLISSAVIKFNEGLKKTQNSVYKKVIGYIKDLSTDSSGTIKKTGGNLITINKVNRVIDSEIRNPTYEARVDEFIKSFDRIDVLQTEYFKSFGDLSASALKYIQELKETAVLNARRQLLTTGIDVNFTDVMKDILKRNVTTGANFSDLAQEVEEFILGNDDIDGRLLSYTKQITSDTLHIYDGAYHQLVSGDLGLEYVKYSGTAKDTTREFCSDRIGNFYHEEEVRSWASLDWSGKMRGTTSSNIFQRVGGYNCRHSILYVSSAIVPDSVKERAKSKGYIK